MLPQSTISSAPLPGLKSFSFFMLLGAVALSTPVFLALLNKSYIRGHLMAALLALFLYAAGSMLLKFAEGAGLGFIASLAGLMAAVEILLVFAEAMFLLWGPKPAALMFLAYTLLCSICNVTLLIWAIKRFRLLERADARIQLWQFFAGFAASFLLVCVLGRSCL
jgi:hypothetical protein